MPRSPIGKRGLTLLELVAVLAIIALASAIAMASMAPMLEKAKLHAAGRTAISMLRYARSYAALHGTETGLVISDTGRVLSVQTNVPASAGGASGASGTSSVAVVTSPAGRLRTLPDGITAEIVQQSANISAEPNISFSPQGTSLDTVLIIKDEHGRQLVIYVDAITGRCEFLNVGP